jgi:hypothetical protein
MHEFFLVVTIGGCIRYTKGLIVFLHSLSLHRTSEPDPPWLGSEHAKDYCLVACIFTAWLSKSVNWLPWYYVESASFFSHSAPLTRPHQPGPTGTTNFCVSTEPGSRRNLACGGTGSIPDASIQSPDNCMRRAWFTENQATNHPLRFCKQSWKNGWPGIVHQNIIRHKL